MNKESTQKELKDIESARMEFGRRMKSPKTLIELKEGHPYGDIRYASFDKFNPAGGRN